MCTPDGIDCQETVDERDEYTLTGTEQTEDSPTKTFSEYEKGKIKMKYHFKFFIFAYLNRIKNFTTI